MDYGQEMAANSQKGPQNARRVLSLLEAPATDAVVHRLPSAFRPSIDEDRCLGKDLGRGDDVRFGYAIELPERSERTVPLGWEPVSHHHVFVDGALPTPSSGLQVTAGFIYRCGTAIRPTSGTPVGVERFARLCDEVKAACAGWSLGLLVTDDTAPGRGVSSIHGLSRSDFVDANGTPPHLFELTFSYVGGDDEVRSQSAYGSDALTSPIAAVSWLAQELGEQGTGLEAGDTVFSGGLTTRVPVVMGGTYRAVSSSLGISTDFGVGL